MTDDSADRRAALLQAATGVFLRYGYRKTSMDAVAQAAGLSRQGLYLWFRSKEALFREAVEALQLQARAAFSQALARPDQPLPDRLLQAYDAVHGPYVGAEVEARHLAELVQTAQALLGPAFADQERDMRLQVTGALGADDDAAAWARAGLSPADLADCLYALAVGNKHLATDRQDYRTRMALGLRILLGSNTP